MEYPKITLEAARVNAHMTQKAAAQALHITADTLRSYETGRTLPSYDMVKAMSSLYSFPYDLISFSERAS